MKRWQNYSTNFVKKRRRSDKLEIHACSNPSPLEYTMFQHEVFQIISILNAGSLCLRHVNHGNTNTRLFFWGAKGHKIVEILALSTTKLQTMFFSIQWTLI